MINYLFKIIDNDRSVLENMHCYYLFKIISEDSTNILKELNRNEY